MSTSNQNLETNVGRQEDDEAEIDLGRLFRAIGKNIWAVICATLLFALVFLLVTVLVIHPTYRSGFTAFVNNRNSKTDDTSALTSGDTSAAQSLAYTDAAIISSRSVIMDAAKLAGLDYEYEDLKDCVSTEVESQTQLVNVYVTMEDAQEAYNLASAIERTAPSYIADIVAGSSMKTVTEPNFPDSPYSPSKTKNTAIGALLGALLAVIIIVVRELTDTRIRSQEDLEDMFGISVIGSIPDFSDAEESKGYGYYGSGSKK